MSTPLHPDLAAVKVHVDRLHSLLADPQPGLFMWNEAVLDCWTEIAEQRIIHPMPASARSTPS